MLNDLNLKAKKFTDETEEHLDDAKWLANAYKETLINTLNIGGNELKKQSYISFMKKYEIKKPSEASKLYEAVVEVYDEILEWNSRQENPVDIRDIWFDAGINGIVYQKNFFFFKYNFFKWSVAVGATLVLKPNKEYPPAKQDNQFITLKKENN